MFRAHACLDLFSGTAVQPMFAETCLVALTCLDRRGSGPEELRSGLLPPRGLRSATRMGGPTGARTRRGSGGGFSPVAQWHHPVGAFGIVRKEATGINSRSLTHVIRGFCSLVMRCPARTEAFEELDLTCEKE